MSRHATLLDADELIRFGERLGAGLGPGDVIYLSGELGTGKTTLARAICRGYGAARAATSPTFALVHRYETRRGPVYHVDCYRLRDPDEARDLDFEGMAREDGLIVIEWPERAGAWSPPPTRHISLRHVADPNVRMVEEV